MDGVKNVENNLASVLKHWGFGELCASIYATLALSDKPLTAEEIAENIDYAYTTTINALNKSIELGYLSKKREGRKYVYYINSDLSDIIKKKLGEFLKLLEKTEESLNKLDKKYRKNLGDTLHMIGNAIKFLRKMEGIEE